MRWEQGTPRRASPFSRLTRSECAELERRFLEFWVLCVETEDDDEEAWAFGQMRALWFEHAASADAADWFSAMEWASERLYRAPDPMSGPA
jgi:hypothetical protein